MLPRYNNFMEKSGLKYVNGGQKYYLSWNGLVDKNSCFQVSFASCIPSEFPKDTAECIEKALPSYGGIA